MLLCVEVRGHMGEYSTRTIPAGAWWAPQAQGTLGNAGETWDWSPTSLPESHRMPRHCDTMASREERVVPIPNTSRSRHTWDLMPLDALGAFLVFAARWNVLGASEN